MLARVSELRRRKNRAGQKQRFQAVEQSYLRETSRLSVKTGSSVKAIRAQERILALLFRNPDFLPFAEGTLMKEDFTDPVLRTLFAAVCEKIRAGERLDLGSFENLTNEETDRLVALCGGAQNTGTKKEFHDCLDVLKKEREARQRSAVNAGTLDNDAWLKLIQSNQKKS